MAADLPELVRDCRRRSGLSMRQAATAGGVSNTTWSRFESGVGQLTPGIVQAVSRAFGWPTDWPDNPPEVSQPVDVVRRVEQLEQDLHDLAASYELAVMLWREERQTLADAVERLEHRVEQISAGG